MLVLEEMTDMNPLDGFSLISAIDYGRLSDGIESAWETTTESESHEDHHDLTYALFGLQSRRQF